jgi:arabinogalactan endo-1,4-beta-galactosidase
MTDLEKLVREVLIPRIVQLEIEVAALRKHTWPYVQAQREHNQLDDIETKRDFIKSLDEDTIKELLNLKAKYSQTSGLQKSEYDHLKNHFC